MPTLDQLELEINEIKSRNKRVEADKAWETSVARKLTIAILTYFVIVIFFYSAKLPRPWLNAIVPTIGFLLSTLTLPIIKNWWIKKTR